MGLLDTGGRKTDRLQGTPRSSQPPKIKIRLYPSHTDILVSEVRLSRAREQGATSRNAAIGCEQRASRQNIHGQRAYGAVSPRTAGVL